MNNLEADIQSTHKSIIQCLTLYEKQSEQFISLNFTTQLHNILDAISTFDPDQLKSIQQQLRDQIALKHINTISNKIKSSLTSSKPMPNINPQPTKRQARIIKEETRKNDNKTQEKKQGFFGTVLKRFASKQKKASQIILPDNEPNCYFDPVKRIWIFQGQEPDIPKQVPKPPSKSQIIKPKQAKAHHQGSEMNNLTAPPEFKRKGASTAVKKVKKQIKTVETSEEPMVFAKVIESINKEYEVLLERVKSGFYELPVKQVHVDNQSQLTDFIRLAQVVLHSSEQIAQYEHRLAQKLSKSSAGEGHQLKLLEKILKEVSQSSNIYSRISNNLQSISRQSISRSFRSETSLSLNPLNFHTSPQNNQKQMSNKFRQQLQDQKLENWKLVSDFGIIKNQNQILERDLKIMFKQKEDLLQQNLRLKRQIETSRSKMDQLSIWNSETNNKLERNFIQKQLQLKRTNEHLIKQNKELAAKIQNMKKEYHRLQETKNQAQRNLLILQSNNNNSNDRMKDEIMKQKAKIQSQLKFYEEKEKNFLKNMKNIQEHTTIIQEFEDTLKQENKLLNAILQQRIQLLKVNDYDESIPIYHKNFEQFTSPHTVILQLSDIINSITQTHLQRLQSFNRNYITLSKKYQQAKQLNKKIKNSTVSQNMSLNRSVSRLKSLIESYKTAKDEAEERNTHLQLQCEKLKKKLVHYKEEDKFNKSYLSKIKSSENNNQNESVISLQQDNEQLAQTIEDLQKQVNRKDQNCIKLQKDLEDILVNYEKTQQKLLTMQKKTKESEKQLRILKDEKQNWINKMNLLQVKLVNQKEKNEEIVQRQLSKIKTIQKNQQKKLKILRQELQRSQTNEQYFKKEIEQLINQKNTKIKNLQADFSEKIAQLKNNIDQKENELNELLLLIQQSNQNNSQKQQQIRRLQHLNQQLQKKCVQISRSIHDYNKDELIVLKESQQVHNNMIQQILHQFKSYKEQQFDFRKDYQAKILYLMNQLADSQYQSKNLLQSIDQYSTMLNSLDRQLLAVEEQKQLSKNQESDLIKSLQGYNKELAETIQSLQTQTKQKKQQISDLQLLTQSLSSQVESLRSQNADLRKKNTEYTHLEGHLQEKDQLISQKSEQLATKIILIADLESKIIELQEQNKILCSQLQKSQIQSFKKQLVAKDDQINDLQNELNKLSNTLLDIEANRDDELKLKYEQQIKLLKEAFANKQKQLQEMSEAFQNSSKQQVALEVDKNYAQKQLQQSKTVINLLQQEIAQLKRSIFQILDQNKSLRQANQQFKSSSQSKQNQPNDLSSKNISNPQQIQELKTKISQLQHNIQQQVISSKEIQERKDEDVEGEMEYLLKQIQDRQAQINQLKDVNQSLKSQIKQLTDKNSQLINTLEVQKKKQISQTNQINQKMNQIQKLQNQNKQLTELIQSLSKEQLSAQENIIKIEQINKLQQEFTQLQITNQQNQRLRIKAQKQLGQKTSQIDELQTKIAQLSELLEHDEKLLQNNRTQDNSKINSDNSLRQELLSKDNENAELKRKLQQINKLIVQKENDFEGKIQSLQREIILLNSLKVTNKKLEDQYKQLDLENSTLLTEKVELMRSNDNLMKINQKLVVEISPHNKIASKNPPKLAQKPQQTAQNNKEQSKQEIKSQMKQTKAEKQDAKGFLGTLSSFFLTPTETDRLVRK